VCLGRKPMGEWARGPQSLKGVQGAGLGALEGAPVRQGQAPGAGERPLGAAGGWPAPEGPEENIVLGRTLLLLGLSGSQQTL